MQNNSIVSNDITALVFDLGSKTSKVGYAGEFDPKGVFPSTPNLSPKADLHWPINDGLVTDEEKYADLVQHSYDYLGVDSKEHPLMLVDAPWNTSKGREELCELYFEKFNVPGFYLGRSAVLSAYV